MELLLVAGPVVSTVGGGIIKAQGAKMAGEETARAAEFERQQLEIQAQTERTAADQAEAQRRRDLTSNLETIQALRAGRGVGASSPTGTAILTNEIAEQERNINIERANARSRADLSRRASLLAGRKARTSLLAGQLGQAGAYLETAGNLTKLARSGAA